MEWLKYSLCGFLSMENIRKTKTLITNEFVEYRKSNLADFSVLLDRDFLTNCLQYSFGLWNNAGS